MKILTVLSSSCLVIILAGCNSADQLTETAALPKVTEQRVVKQADSCDTEREILDIRIPTGKKAVKKADFNRQNYNWLTTQVFPEILRKNDPVNNFIGSAIKYYTLQPEAPSALELLASAQKLEQHSADNSDFMMWLGYAYMVNKNKKEARSCLNKAFPKMIKTQEIPACRKFLCGIFLSDAYDYRNAVSQKTATKTVQYLIDAMNQKEITDNEGGFVFRMLAKNRRSGPMLEMFLKHSGTLGQPDGWLVNICRGHLEIDKAWDARGGGWANTVTEAGWEGFYKHLGLAEKYLTAAWKQQPKLPEAPAKMITVATGKEGSCEQLDVIWFNQAVAAQVDYLPAYKTLLWFRRPRWCGSYKQMLEIGEAALLSGHYDTLIPLVYFNALADIAGELPHSNWRAVFRYPGVYELLEQTCRKMLEHPHTPEEIKVILTAQFWIREFCGRYQLAIQTLDKLGGVLPGKDGYSSCFTRQDFVVSASTRVKIERDLFSGPYKKQLNEAETLCINGHYKIGADKFIEVLKLLKDPVQKKYLIKRIARALDPNESESAYRSDCGLHIAAYETNVPLVKLLLGLGAGVNEVDRRGRTPLHAAICKNSGKSDADFAETVKLLFDHGADINARNSSNYTVLHFAVNGNKVKIVEMLIARGADVNTFSKKGWSPLASAIYKKRPLLAEKLILAGADVNALREENGWTPSHYAAHVGDAKTLQLLIDKGAKILIFSKRHQTPLHLAAHKGNLESAEILIQNGIDINLRGGNTLTPLDHAIHCSSPERRLQTVKRFVELGADINKRDGSGWSPVYRCARFNMPNVLVYLLDKGADINLKDKRGKTALDMAKNQQITKILLAHNAKYGKDLP